MLQQYQEWFTQFEAEIKEGFFTFLKFPSISTDEAYRKETRECADWVGSVLKEMGFSVSTWETSGHPVVYGSLLSEVEGAPTLLFYQHYDVQPDIPLDEWKSPPFEPEEREGAIYARGAVDNKGQCFYVLTALRAFLENNKAPPVNLKVVIEGEEEVGSLGLEALLAVKKDELQADYVFVSDFDMLDVDQPAVTIGCRGVATLNLTLRNSRADLHSGSFGGVVTNPATLLVQALSKCFDEQGQIIIPGFHDGITPLNEEEREALYWELDVRNHTTPFGVKAFMKETSKELLESNWLLPTLEINGMESGYTGEGEKTIIPACAMVKLSCRIAAGQDPSHVIDSLLAFLLGQLPEGIIVTPEKGHQAKGYRSSPNSTIVNMVTKAYEEVFEAPCRKILCGATVPIVPKLAAASGGELAMMGVGLAKDGMHSPNESFDWKRFRQGFLATAILLEQVIGES